MFGGAGFGGGERGCGGDLGAITLTADALTLGPRVAQGLLIGGAQLHQEFVDVVAADDLVGPPAACARACVAAVNAGMNRSAGGVSGTNISQSLISERADAMSSGCALGVAANGFCLAASPLDLRDGVLVRLFGVLPLGKDVLNRD